MEEKVNILQKAQERVSPEAARLLEERVRKGLETYGMTLDENQAPLEERLQHALEEALDLLQYLEWAREVAPEGLEAQLDELCVFAAEIANVLARINADEPPDDPGEWVEWRDLEGPTCPQSSRHQGASPPPFLLLRRNAMKNIRERIEGFLSRLERAEAILLDGRLHRVEGMPHTYVVRGSQNYLVDLEKETCTCPDHARGHTCKHLLAAVLLERGEKKAVQRMNEAVKAA